MMASRNVSYGLSIGQIADRTGLAVSAIRFYEERGLVTPDQNSGGQRRFGRADIRRLSFVMICQQLGFSLAEIRILFAGLPQGRTPTKTDWTRISRSFRATLDARIGTMTLLREKLDGCIGCGCLSLASCKLYNPDDQARDKGMGPIFLMVNPPDY